MSYTPTTWVTGDTVTATKLNKIEHGIANSSSYDAEIYIYHDDNSSNDYEVSILSGSFTSISQMVSNDIPPNILVRICDYLSHGRAVTSAVAIYYSNFNVSVPYINFVMQVPCTNTGSSAYNWNGVRFIWYSNGDIELS